MKLLGLSAGRKMGNSEILLKEALRGAAEHGADVELLRLLDHEIKPCNGCVSCVQGKRGLIFGGPGDCVVQDDDMALFDEKLRECDGLIVAAPVYVFQPPGYLKLLADRCGPSHDQAFIQESARISGSSTVDPRALKTRVGGLIAVGGAPHADWVSLGLPLMHSMTMSMNIQVVDKLQVNSAAQQGQVAVDDDALARARTLGGNVADQLGRSLEEIRYVGDTPGTCPVCHCDALIVRAENPVECAICGIHGELALVDGRITVTFTPEEQAMSRLHLAGKRRHFFEIGDVQQQFDAQKAEARRRMREYRSYQPVWKD